MEIHGYTKPKIVGKVIFHYFKMVLVLYPFGATTLPGIYQNILESGNIII